MVPKFPAEGRYDVRAGASAYAPIVGSFGALSVAAIVVVFTQLPPGLDHDGITVVLATGLLVIGMLGSLLGAFGMAAIGAEQAPTANLGASIMYIAVPVATSIVATIGAFEVLAAVYEPASKTLFAIITAGVGLFGVIFTSFAIADSTSLGPRDTKMHKDWAKTQWVKSHKEANRYAFTIALAASVPVLAAVAFRVHPVVVHFTTRAEANWTIGVGVFLTLAGTLASLTRSAHNPDGSQIGIQRAEAVITTLAVGGYVLLMEVFLP